MVILMILPFLFGDFVQKWYFPRGMIGECGRLLICDTDRDGNHEFYIRTYGGSQKIYIYELHLPETWEVDSFSYFWGPLVWDIGDFDLDGLFDLAIQTAVDTPPNNLISIAESPDSFSYPTQEVWRDTVGFPLVTPISVYDIDQDGYTEIVKVGANGIDFVIYESIADNFYARIYEDTIQGITTPVSTIAFGDFDEDNNIEFVLGNLSDGIGAAYWLYESPMNNTYEFVYLGSVSTYNIKDCFSVPDADGDGKPEFVVKGYIGPTARIHAFIFEAISDNTYEIVKSFDLPGGHSSYYGGYSDVGDVDGDSIPEIALEACQNIYIIKAAGNDSFYVWETLSGNNNGSSVRVFDIDGNGLSEVIISGDDHTRIYEYEVGIAEEAASEVLEFGLAVSPNPFTDMLQIQCQTRPGDVVQVIIYDVSGRVVKRLYKGTPSTAQTLIWHSDGENCGSVPSGIYFLRVEYLTSGDVSCQKVLKVK